jgi:hypothetical protein
MCRGEIEYTRPMTPDNMDGSEMRPSSQYPHPHVPDRVVLLGLEHKSSSRTSLEVERDWATLTIKLGGAPTDTWWAWFDHALTTQLGAGTQVSFNRNFRQLSRVTITSQAFLQMVVDKVNAAIDSTNDRARRHNIQARQQDEQLADFLDDLDYRSSRR